MLTRRHFLASTLAAPPFCVWDRDSPGCDYAENIAPVFPAAPSDKGDFRDRLCRVFAAEVAKPQRRRNRGRDLSELIADQTTRNLGDA